MTMYPCVSQCLMVNNEITALVRRHLYSETTPRMIKILRPSDAYMPQWTRSSLVQLMAWHLFDPKPLPEPMMTYSQLGIWKHTSGILNENTKYFIKKMWLKLSSAKCQWFYFGIILFYLTVLGDMVSMLHLCYQPEHIEGKYWSDAHFTDDITLAMSRPW